VSGTRRAQDVISTAIYYFRVKTPDGMHRRNQGVMVLRDCTMREGNALHCAYGACRAANGKPEREC
jgi:hypothetical protein